MSLHNVFQRSPSENKNKKNGRIGKEYNFVLQLGHFSESLVDQHQYQLGWPHDPHNVCGSLVCLPPHRGDGRCDPKPCLVLSPRESFPCMASVFPCVAWHPSRRRGPVREHLSNNALHNLQVCKLGMLRVKAETTLILAEGMSTVMMQCSWGHILSLPANA